MQPESTIRITLLRQLFTARACITVMLVFLLSAQLSADIDLIPPEQDYFLHFSQFPVFSQGVDALTHGYHGHRSNTSIQNKRSIPNCGNDSPLNKKFGHVRHQAFLST